MSASPFERHLLASESSGDHISLYDDMKSKFVEIIKNGPDENGEWFPQQKKYMRQIWVNLLSNKDRYSEFIDQYIDVNSNDLDNLHIYSFFQLCNSLHRDETFVQYLHGIFLNKELFVPEEIGLRADILNDNFVPIENGLRADILDGDEIILSSDSDSDEDDVFKFDNDSLPDDETLIRLVTKGKIPSNLEDESRKLIKRIEEKEKLSHHFALLFKELKEKSKLDMKAKEFAKNNVRKLIFNEMKRKMRTSRLKKHLEKKLYQRQLFAKAEEHSDTNTKKNILKAWKEAQRQRKLLALAKEHSDTNTKKKLHNAWKDMVREAKKREKALADKKELEIKELSEKIRKNMPKIRIKKAIRILNAKNKAAKEVHKSHPNYPLSFIEKCIQHASPSEIRFNEEETIKKVRAILKVTNNHIVRIANWIIKKYEDFKTNSWFWYRETHHVERMIHNFIIENENDVQTEIIKNHSNYKFWNELTSRIVYFLICDFVTNNSDYMAKLSTNKHFSGKAFRYY